MAKNKQPWDAVFDRVRVIRRIDGIYPPAPTPTELDSVETELHFKFPLSYREFAERFGLNGELFALPHLLPLRKPVQEGWSVVGETLDLRATYREYWFVRTPSSLFERMVIFAEDGGYEKFVFDPQEVTDPKVLEYRIYSIDKTADITPLADSFAGFLDWISDRYRPDPEGLEFHEEELLPLRREVAKPHSSTEPAIEYRPYRIRTKEVPATSDVTLWLAWNNHTVRDLARSIRDRGQTDAYPILADALQEAGCTNADLLDSCRTGDPDIDGVWALRVLLGNT